MQVRVNGDLLELESSLSIDQLLTHLKYTASHVAVAVNFECVRRAEFPTRNIQGGDEIEILSPQAGG